MRDITHFHKPQQGIQRSEKQRKEKGGRRETCKIDDGEKEDVAIAHILRIKRLNCYVGGPDDEPHG